MKDEEMAEEYAKDYFRLYCPQDEELRAVKQAFLAGLKAGRPQWHKPSEKLPEECSLVLAYAFDDTEPSLWEFVTSDQWEWLPKRIVFCSNDQIRLWKEIVLPKESE